MAEFEQIYETYFNDVFLFIKSLSKNESVAEELTSETFFKAMRSIDRFRGDCDIRVWLCQIAKNCYFSYLKKHPAYVDLEEAESTVLFRLFIYQKVKKAKKYRRDEEYGSARWGTPEDIKPFTDPVFKNNVILTGTEQLTMNTRPKNPANARKT